MNRALTRVLLVESDEFSARLVTEALTEAGEHAGAWSREYVLLHAETLDEGVALAEAERFDAVLLNLSLPDSSGAATFLRMRQICPEAAILVLTTEDDEPLATSLVREGAQDYIPPDEVDSLPLSRAICQAIERQRVAAAFRSASLYDELTGFYTASAFSVMAIDYVAVLRRIGQTPALLLVDVDPSSLGPAGSAVLLDIAEAIRTWFSEAGPVARILPSRFAIISGSFPQHAIEGLRRSIEKRLGPGGAAAVAIGCRPAGPAHRDSPTLAGIVADAERSLCENMSARRNVPSEPRPKLVLMRPTL